MPLTWERANGTGELPPKADPTGKRVAVVGSGPSGLTVAGDLIAKGHDVTILEAFHKPGGVLVYGIPEFRLPKAIVAQEVNFLERLGVRAVDCNQVVGRTVSLDELFEEGYDAIYIGVGAGLPRFMNLPGENLVGILSANEYLTRGQPHEGVQISRGGHADSPGQERGGARRRQRWPWTRPGPPCAWAQTRCGSFTGGRGKKCRPETPRSITPRKRGSSFFCCPTPPNTSAMKRGRLTGMECIRMELGEPDDSGRRRPVPVKGSEFELECDLCIVAVGSGANPLLTSETPDMRLNRWGYIVADEKTGKTTKRGVWAGGDIVTGAATVILAMGAGRKSADSMHDFLTMGW